MTDYHPLIAQGTAALENNTAEARRALYERARAALVAKLETVSPPMSESEIRRERLALEGAIRKVEAEQIRRLRPARAPLADKVPKHIEPAGPIEILDSAASIGQHLQADTPAPAESTDRAPTVAPHQSDLSATQRPSDRIPALDAKASVGNEDSTAGGSAGPADEIFVEPEAGPAGTCEVETTSREVNATNWQPPLPPAPASPAPVTAQASSPPAEIDAAELDAALRGLRIRFAAEGTEIQRRGPSAAPDMGDSVPLGRARDVPVVSPRRTEALKIAAGATASAFAVQSTAGKTEHGAGDAPQIEAAPQRRRIFGTAIFAALGIAVLAIVGGLGALVYHEREGLFALLQMDQAPSSPTDRQQAQIRPKFEDRIPQGTVAPAAGPAAAASRVILYEEDPSDPSGRQVIGSVIWRTEIVAPGPGLASEMAVKASIEIPERQVAMSLSMVRNTDPALPASHTIDIRFNLPPGFAGGGIANVPGVLMKQSEQTRGVPLAGLAVRVTDNIFLIGLSSVESDVYRNAQLLRERAWFDIPIVYSNGRRAILAMEKGAAGERAFNDAFAAWERTAATVR